MVNVFIYLYNLFMATIFLASPNLLITASNFCSYLILIFISVLWIATPYISRQLCRSERMWLGLRKWRDVGVCCWNRQTFSKSHFRHNSESNKIFSREPSLILYCYCRVPTLCREAWNIKLSTSKFPWNAKPISNMRAEGLIHLLGEDIEDTTHTGYNPAHTVMYIWML